MKTLLNTVSRPALFPWLNLAMAITLACGLAQKAAAGTQLWIGVDGTTTSTNWSDPANWNLNGSPNGNDLVFGDTGGVGTLGQVTSVADQNLLNPNSLTFTNGFSGTLYQTVFIQPGISVTNANGLTAGKPNLAANNYVIYASLAGPGTLVQKGTTMTIDNSSSTAGSGVMATLDMSGLSNFVATALTTLNIAGSGGEARGEGTLTLAQTNYIVATSLTMNTGSGNSANTGGTLNLGQATNSLYVTTMTVGQTKGNASKVQFFGATGSLKMRGVTGADTDRNVTITLGDRNNSGSGTTSGQFLFNGHLVDIKAATLLLGQDRSSSSSSAHTGSGTVQFDTGTIDVTTITMAISTSAGTSSSANGTIIVGTNGTLVVGTGGVTMGNKSGGSTGATANLGVNSGTVTSSGNFTKVNSGAVANFSMTNGVLNMASGTTMGTSSLQIDNVYLSGATNNFVAGPGVVVYANTLTTGNGNVINIASVPIVTSYPKQYPLISYAGSIQGSGFNFALGTLPSGSPAYQGYISNNTANLSIDLVLTNGPLPSGVDVWTGVANNNWDLTSVNWTNSGSPVAFHQGDAVQMDDTAPGPTNINLATNLIPSSLTVSNNLLAYTLGGTGAISGAGNLVKYGTSSLTLTNGGTNAFTGGITINAGTVQFGNGSSLGNLPANAQGITDNGNLVLDLSSRFPVSSAISGTGNLDQNGSGVVSLTASNSYSGNTLLNAGSLMVDGYIGGGGTVTSASSTTLGGTNTIIGTVSVGGTVNPGDVNGIGTLTVNGNTTLNAGANCVFDLNFGNTTTGSGINDLLALTGTGNLNANNNTISINVQGVPQPGTYGVITYSGTLTGTFNATVAGTHFTANVDTTPANQVNVVITGTSGANMKWDSVSSSAWDNKTANWLNLGTSLPDDFYSGDTVLMDDSVAGVVTNLVIPTGVSMYPLIISNISSANNYVISGGGIGGTASLVKDGTSTLTISDANTYSGTVDVYNGTLVTANGSALGSTSGGTTIFPGATIDIDGQNLGSEPVTVSGTGVGSLGAIINSGAVQENAFKDVTLAGDTIFGGSSRWDIRGGSATLNTSGSPVNITKIGTNQVSLVACTCNDGNLENVNIQSGIFALQTSSTQFGDQNGFIYVSSNAELDVYALTAGLNKNVWLLDGGMIYSENSSTAFSGTLTLTNNLANTAPGTGIITNNSGTTLVVNSTVQGPGNLLKTGAGLTQLSAANTYTGNTTVSVGTLALTGSGSISTSPNITVSSGAIFDVSAVAPLTLASGQTLQGSGTVNGSVNVATGSTLAAGTPAAIGTLTDVGDVALSGNCNLKLNRTASPTSDVITNSGALSMGGTLNVTLLGGTLQNGDTFTLFKSAGGISGTFAVTNLPTLGAGLGWNTTNLASGILSVYTTVNTNPTNITVMVSGNSLTLSWPADHTGWRLLAQTNPLTSGLNPAPGAWFTVQGSTSVDFENFTMDPTKGTVFYRLVYP